MDDFVEPSIQHMRRGHAKWADPKVSLAIAEQCHDECRECPDFGGDICELEGCSDGYTNRRRYYRYLFDPNRGCPHGQRVWRCKWGADAPA